jgi:hypothetical protein
MVEVKVAMYLGIALSFLHHVLVKLANGVAAGASEEIGYQAVHQAGDAAYDHRRTEANGYT